jgi:hypothetical protein
MTDIALQRRYDILPYASDSTLPTINMCTAYDDLFITV